MREVVFKTDNINVIVGNSQSGKTAMIKIIDYCLGSSECDIPVGTIIDSCSWFGIVIEKENKYLILARKSPKKTKASDEMYFNIQETDKIPNFKNISANKNRNYVKNYFNNEFNLSNSGWSENNNFKKLRPSYRNTVGINFFPQQVLLDHNNYFYKSDNAQYAERFKFMFPYLMGRFGIKHAYIKQQIEYTKFLLAINQKDYNTNMEIKSEWESHCKENVIKASTLGLISSVNTTSFSEDIDILKKILEKNTHKIYETENLISSNRLYLENSEKEQTLYKELMITNNRLRVIESQMQVLDQLDVRIEEFKNNIKLTNWLISEKNFLEKTTEDLYLKEIHEEIYNTLVQNEMNIQFYETLRTPLNKEYKSLLLERDILENKLNNTQKFLCEILKNSDVENIKFKENYKLLERYQTFYGEIKSFLEVYEKVQKTEKMSEEEIQSLNVTLEKLEDELKIFEGKSIDEINTHINGTLDSIIDDFSVEYKKGKVRFDFNKIELKIKNDNTEVKLSKIGSGANAVEYHIIMAFLIHIYIQNEVKKKCTFDFVVFDQPSEAYFPESNGEERSIEDKEKVKKMFRNISNIQKSYCNKLQIIIFEHADEEYWLNSEKKLFHDKINIINWKETKEKLIPKEWIK